MNSLQGQVFEFSRINLAAAVDLMTAPLEGMARLQTQQLTLITQVLTGNAKLAASLDRAQSPEDMTGVYETMVREQLAGISAYWTGVQHIAVETQTALRQRQNWGLALQREIASTLGSGADECVLPGGDVVHSTVTAISAGLSNVARAAAESARQVAEQAASQRAENGADKSKARPQPQRQAGAQS